MNTTVFIAVMVICVLVYLVVGFRASRGQGEGRSYFLADRGLGRFPLALSVMATQLGGGIILGAADEAYRVGWSVLLWPAGYALGLLILGLGVGKRLRGLGVTTLAEVFTKKYGLRSLRTVASVLSIGSLFFVLVAQLIASRRFLEAMGFAEAYWFAGLWLVVIGYTVIGGLRAVVYTDVLQTILIGAFLSIAFLWSPSGGGGSFASVAIDGSLVSSWFVLPFLFMIIGQDMGQRCFAGRSGRDVSWAFGLASVGVLVVCTLPIALAISAQKTGVVVPEGASALLVAASALTNPVIASLIGCAVLVAILSTADSLLSAIGSNLAYDLPFPKQSLIKSQLLTLAVGGAAVACSLIFKEITAVLLFAYELSVSTLSVPLLAALFIRRPRPGAAIGSVVGGLVGIVLFRFVPFPTEIGSLALSGLGYTLGMLPRRREIVS